MKLTKKQINVIINHTPENLKGTFPTITETVGYFMKAQTNWSYRAGYTDGGVLVVTVFGEVQ